MSALSMLGALLFTAPLAAGSDGVSVLRPVRVIKSDRGTFMSIARASKISSWLLPRMEGEVYKLADGSSRFDLTLSQQQKDGQPLLFSALTVATNDERMIVADVQNGNLIEADLVTGKPLRATPERRLFPGAGMAWNGTSWVIAGYINKEFVVQFREPKELKVVATYHVPEVDRQRLRRISYEGSIAASNDGTVVVSFYALRRAIVLDRNGHETMSLALPIADEQYVSDAGRVSAPNSTEDVLRLWRGRVTPRSVWFTGDDPSVLLQSPDEPRSVTWCRFSKRDGRLLKTYSLDIPLEPRSSFKAAIHSEGRKTTLMVVRTWKDVSDWHSSVYEFLVPQ
ncbi:MAG: hypothetical protein JNK60_09740 [Acidobacteria bacterium]|nr:hypothetical protein [Acidobacteriota bacterium]